VAAFTMSSRADLVFVTNLGGLHFSHSQPQVVLVPPRVEHEVRLSACIHVERHDELLCISANFSKYLQTQLCR
jgi:hypothetical protein